MGERGVSSIIVVIAIVFVITAASVGGFFLLKGKTTGTSKPLSAYALNAKDVPWLENLVENEVSGVFVNEFSASQLSEWGENGLYFEGIYQLNPNYVPHIGPDIVVWSSDNILRPGKGSVAYQLTIRFKDADGAIKCYEFAEPLYENVLDRQFLNAQGIEDITPESLSTVISEFLTRENLTFVSASDRGFIISVRDNLIGYNFGGAFVVWLQHSNLVDGLIIAENSYLDLSVVGDIVPSITKSNAITIAQTAYEKMTS